MDDRYCTVFTKEFEGMKARIAELEARWEKLKEGVGCHAVSTDNRCWKAYSVVLNTMERLEREAKDGAEGKDFCCPKCGSPYFGRDVVEGEDGKPMVLETVRCHGDSSGPKIYGKCDWRGVWPPEAKDGGE